MSLALLVGRAPPFLGYAQPEDWRCGRDGYQEIDHRLSQSLGLVVQVRVEQSVDPVGLGRAVPGPRERPPPRPEQYGAVPHIDSGILPICPSIVRRHGLPPVYRPRHAFVCR